VSSDSRIIVLGPGQPPPKVPDFRMVGVIEQSGRRACPRCVGRPRAYACPACQPGPRPGLLQRFHNHLRVRLRGPERQPPFLI
jgi:hypothetical protein